MNVAIAEKRARKAARDARGSESDGSETVELYDHDVPYDMDELYKPLHSMFLDF